MQDNLPQEMESKEGIDALFHYATEGILVVNDIGKIVRINPGAEVLFGYEKDELLGQTIEQLIPKRLAVRHKDSREKYHGNPHARSMGAGMALFGLKKDMTEIPVEVSLSPYTNEHGKFVIAFIVDITLRKQAEEKLQNYSEDLQKQVKNRTLILEEAVEELQRTKMELDNALKKEKDLSELKSRFVEMASHEFRTPLTTMLSSLSLISKYGGLGDIQNQVKHIGKIKASINNLTDILNDFLSISKLEEGRIGNYPEKVNLKDFITDIIQEMEGMAKKGQEFSFHHEGIYDAKLDIKLIKNILFNLISNAIKFSPEDGKIVVNSVCAVNSLTISVKDNGIGISEEDQKHLYERFYRGHNATHIQGTGLGLSIVVKYLELMKGSLNLESRENEGTTFTLIIPQHYEKDTTDRR